MNKADHDSSFSFLRYVGTLSSGAIALQIGFLERVFPHPKWKALVAISIILFTAAIIGAVVSQWALLGMVNVAPTESRRTWGGCFMVVMWASFVLGLTLAVVFSLINLFTL
ncbi:MAG TPA: hypothetical protein VGO56_07445 [Pyrinomonadaceae bacterium]|jgi:hypothetical protein|nr:hypothetical protein [Pyrinomonadaceae bacterium]